MELMLIKNARELINHFKTIYPINYQKVIVLIAEQQFARENSNGETVYLKLKDLEDALTQTPKKYDNLASITWHGFPLINDYDLIDVNTINIHSLTLNMELDKVPINK